MLKLDLERRKIRLSYVYQVTLYIYQQVSLYVYWRKESIEERSYRLQGRLALTTTTKYARPLFPASSFHSAPKTSSQDLKYTPNPSKQL
eukprot:1975264-Amphidinium_carterae.1